MDIIKTFGKKHDYPPEVIEKALTINEIALGSEEFIGKNKKGICAASIYLAAKELELGGWKFTQRFISDEFGVSETTLRNRYKELQSKFTEETIYCK